MDMGISLTVTSVREGGYVHTKRVESINRTDIANSNMRVGETERTGDAW